MRFIEVESDAAVHMSLICSPKAGHIHRRPGNAWSIVRCLGQINGPRLGAILSTLLRALRDALQTARTLLRHPNPICVTRLDVIPHAQME
jgi:hypothetical protein